MRRRLLLLLGLAAVPGAAALQAVAAEIAAGEVTVVDPWARATTPGQRNGAGYMRLTNAGAEPDRLMSVQTGAAAMAQAHTTTVDAEGVARMRAVQSIEIPPGGSVELEPGGVHLMLMGLVAPLRSGTTFPVTLTFEKAGPITVEMAVRGAR